MKLKVLITEIIPKLDKNNNDYWIIKGQVDQYTHKSWLCFANDYNLDDKTKSLLTHQSRALINCSAVLTIQKKGWPRKSDWVENGEKRLDYLGLFVILVPSLRVGK